MKLNNIIDKLDILIEKNKDKILADLSEIIAINSV